MLARVSSLLIALAACGSVEVRHIADAPQGGGADASTVDAPPSAVTVTATLARAPIAGAIVYFQSADSTVLATTTTDATGTATGMVGSGGYVTLAQPAPQSVTAAMPDELVTWGDVRPGDHLLFNESTGTITVTFTIPNTSTGAASYVVSTTCGNNSIPVPITAGPPPTTITLPITLSDGCSGPEDILVVGVDGNGQATGSFYVPAQTLTDNGALDLHTQTFTAAISRTYTWTDDSDGATLLMKDELESANGSLYQSAQLTAAGTPPTITRRAPAFGALVDVVKTNATVGNTAYEMDEWGQTTANYTGDWGAHLLPQFTSGPAYTAATKVVSWNSTGGTIQPNAFEVAIGASRASDSHAWNWVVLTGTSPVQLPTLPTTTYDWNIAAADTFDAELTGEINVPGDAGAVRAVALGPTGEAAIAQGAPGVFAMASYQPPPE